MGNASVNYNPKNNVSNQNISIKGKNNSVILENNMLDSGLCPSHWAYSRCDTG